MFFKGTKKNSNGKRIVTVPENLINEEKSAQFCNNRIVTSKFTAWNFFFLMMYIQFKKMFIFEAYTPVSPFTSLVPLVVVIGISMLKSGYEDSKRHKSDSKVNNQECCVIIQGEEKIVKWSDIAVGNVIKVEEDQEIPCDAILLSSFDKRGICHVSTANLDGETNLKMKYAPESTRNFDEISHKDSKFVIEAEGQNADLYRFNGRLTVLKDGSNDEQCSLDLSNFLIRGSKLKNTKYIFAVAVFTGRDTKMFLNLISKINKTSSVDALLNRVVCFIVAFILVVCAALSALKLNFGSCANIWYVNDKFGKKSVKNFFVNFLLFINVLNYLIPISLYVTLEMQRAFNRLFIGWDRLMYDETRNIKARIKNSDIIEDVGQVEYIFTDKTGTLTENVMQYKECFIDNFFYRPDENSHIRVVNAVENDIFVSLNNIDLLVQKENFNKHNYDMFFNVLSLCNTAEIVLDSFDEQKFHYIADSSDEKSLLDGAKKHNVVLTPVIQHEIEYAPTIKSKLFQSIKKITYYDNSVSFFNTLSVLEFTPERRRMSVIVEQFNQFESKYYLFTKGAESSVLPLCTSGDVNSVLSAANLYAKNGYRSLVISYKQLYINDVNEILARINLAKQDVFSKNDSDAIFSLYNTIESGQTVLGATAVEDVLQDSVNDTLEKFKQANIKIWMLTGDKVETAVNIGINCGLINSSTNLFYLTSNQLYKNFSSEKINLMLDDILKEYQNKNVENNNSLVIDGAFLHQINNSTEQKFVHAAINSHVVICCRMSPIQKSHIVKLVKNSQHKPICLAVGDGANDCSMLQEANVGVGIVGNEGRHAAMVADFSVGKFKHLKQLLFVHGHYFYTRISYTILYFLYKNFILMTPVFIHIFNAGFSPVTTYDSVYLTFYGLAFTSLPILVYGVVEQKHPQHTLTNKFQYYQQLSKNSRLTLRIFVALILHSLYQGILIYYSVFCMYNNGGITNTQNKFTLYEFHVLIGLAVFIVVTVQITLDTTYWNYLFLFSILLSVILYLFTYITTSLVNFLINFTLDTTYTDLFISPYHLLNLFSLPKIYPTLFISTNLCLFIYLFYLVT